MPDIEIKSDLMIAVMELIQIESHARFNFIIDGNNKWLDIVNKARITRSKQMAELETEEPNQKHCLNKHILSFIYRSWEVADKWLSKGDKLKAKEYYDYSSEWIEEFYKLNFENENKKEGFFDRIKNNLK